MLTKDEIVEIMSQFGKVEVFEQEYKKFKSQKSKDTDTVIEYLFHMTPM